MFSAKIHEPDTIELMELEVVSLFGTLFAFFSKFGLLPAVGQVQISPVSDKATQSHCPHEIFVIAFPFNSSISCGFSANIIRFKTTNLFLSTR
jgi:hypothetical protein